MPLGRMGVIKGMALFIALGMVGSAFTCSSSVGEQGRDMTVPNETDPGDAIATPPTEQSYLSPNGHYRFEITTPDHWQTQTATGKLYRIQSNQATLLWQSPLPQHYGPRFTVLGPAGQILMLDEAINVASPYAILLLSSEGTNHCPI
jgi:hypothetical protein